MELSSHVGPQLSCRQKACGRHALSAGSAGGGGCRPRLNPACCLQPFNPCSMQPLAAPSRPCAAALAGPRCATGAAPGRGAPRVARPVLLRAQGGAGGEQVRVQGCVRSWPAQTPSRPAAWQRPGGLLCQPHSTLTARPLLAPAARRRRRAPTAATARWPTPGALACPLSAAARLQRPVAPQLTTGVPGAAARCFAVLRSPGASPSPRAAETAACLRSSPHPSPHSSPLAATRRRLICPLTQRETSP